MLLKHYLEQGLSKAELAMRFNVSRRTIHYWIASSTRPRSGVGCRGLFAPVIGAAQVRFLQSDY